MIAYDPHQWWTHFFDVKGSLLREILGRVIGISLWAVVVVLAQDRYGRYFDIPVTVHSIVGTALGLLLVFRTNSAYDRFWEGRKLWGGIVNETRNLVRAARSLLKDKERTAEVARWTIAFSYAGMHGLRGRKELGGGARRLTADETGEAERADHPALHCAARISDTLRDAERANRISSHELVYLDTNVQLLVDYLGGCERIRKTPLPFAYLVHLRRALLIYCLALPFALISDFGWLTVPTTVVVSFIFLGIEEIGVEIEDPFGVDENDLPLEDICATIDRNLGALVEAAI